MKKLSETRTYGCEEFCRLRQVMLHRPSVSLRHIDAENCRQWLFDRVPDIDGFLDEHDAWRQLLEDHDVEVLELADLAGPAAGQVQDMPNLTYLHDVAAVSSHGAILSTMAWPARRGEQEVVRCALGQLGIPIFTDFPEPTDAFEGCLLLSPRTVLVADTERHCRSSIDKFIPRALEAFDEVLDLQVPKERRYMHPDTIFNRISPSLALAYLPAIRRCRLHTRGGSEEVDFQRHMRGRGVEIVSVTDSEQRRLACSFVPLEPGVIFHYDTALNPRTLRLLARKGVEVILFHPRALIAGGGSLRCLTLRLCRR